MSRSRAIGRACLRSEGGFALVEVMVSAVLLVVIALATYPVIDQSAGRSSANRARALAVSLAEQDQDRLRATPWETLETLSQSNDKKWNGVNFTIVSKAEYVSDTSGVFKCASDTGGQQYLMITSVVTWPNMSGIDPVKLESFVSPNVAQGDFGTVTATLNKANGDPLQGITVTVAGQSRVTNENGCAQWTKLAPGQVTLSFGPNTGYYTKTYQNTVSESFNVKAGDSSNKSYTYDRLSTFTGTFRRLSDNASSRWPTVRLVGGGMTWDRPSSTNTTNYANLTEAQMGNYSTSVTGYFPDRDGYKIYAGKCDGNNPENYLGNFYATYPAGVSAPPVPGQPNALVAYTRKVTIDVKKTTTGSGGVLTAYPFVEIKPVMSATGCEPIPRFRVAANTNQVTQPLAYTESRNTANNANAPGAYTNRVVVDLPWGIYSICADNDTIRRKVATFYNTPPGSPAPNAPSADVFTLDLSNISASNPTNGDPNVPSTRSTADCS